MRTLRFIALACLSVTMVACNGNDEKNEPDYGYIEYDGRTFIIDYVEDMTHPLADRWEKPGVSYKELAIGSNPTDGVMSSFDCMLFVTVDPYKDQKLEISDSHRVTFYYDKMMYSTQAKLKLPEYGDDGVWSIGVNPETGLEIQSITGGYFRWYSGADVARFEFRLELADGKTVRGSGKVPMSEFE